MLRCDKPAIQAEALHKSFAAIEVLQGVSFEVARGEVFALLGSNGAGKTTTINILTTLLNPDSGTASICGFDIRKQAANVRESISLTGQNVSVDDILTGRENLMLTARLRRIPRAKEKVSELLERFGLADAADRRVSTYSGGMKRRLDIAMSLVGTPPVIFLDEPTTGLDPEVRLEVWSIIRNLADDGTTIFLTTQYLNEAEQLADHIAVLHKGKIIAAGTLTELRKLFPPAKEEYVVKQPTLEEVFLALINKREGKVHA